MYADIYIHTCIDGYECEITSSLSKVNKQITYDYDKNKQACVVNYIQKYNV